MIRIEELQEVILEKLDLSREIGDEELLDTICRVIKEKGQEIYIPLEERVGLGKELFNALRKLDILQELLEDEAITEIMINGTEYIFVEKEGAIFQLEKRFEDRTKLENVIQQIVAGANRIVNEASPIVDARLEDGSRVNIVLCPVAINGPIVTIRKFPKEVMTMKELVNRQSVSLEMCDFLQKLIVAKYNVFISGGTGSG